MALRICVTSGIPSVYPAAAGTERVRAIRASEPGRERQTSFQHATSASDATHRDGGAGIPCEVAEVSGTAGSPPRRASGVGAKKKKRQLAPNSQFQGAPGAQ